MAVRGSVAASLMRGVGWLVWMDVFGKRCSNEMHVATPYYAACLLDAHTATRNIDVSFAHAHPEQFTPRSQRLG